MADSGSGPGPLGSNQALETRSTVWSMIGLAMLVVIAVVAALALRQVSDSDFWVEHTRQVITANAQLLSDVKNAESAERGFIITGEESYLEPYLLAVQDIPPRQTELRELTADNPAQQERVKGIEDLIAQRLAVLKTAIDRRREKGFASAEQVVASGQGLKVMRQISEAARIIESEEYRLLQQRKQTRQTRLRSGFIATLLAAIFALVALVLGPLDVRRVARLRRVALQEKEESAQTTQALFQSAAQAILIVDSNGRIVMVNPATEQLFGYASDELVGQNVDVLVPESLRGRHKNNRDQYFRSPQSRPMGLGMDLHAHRKDGTDFFAEISLSYIRSSRETLGVAFVSDISKRREYEQALHQQREELRTLTRQLMTAQDDERRRIARDLHDDLSQQLAFLAMDMGKLATKPPAAEWTAELRPLQLRAADAAESVRRISHQLHPSILDDIGLEAALEQYCEEFERRSGITTQFTSREVPEGLNAEIARSLYHIAQECLRNVAKHAKAQAVSVAIESTENVLRLTVKDSGIGLGATQSSIKTGIGIVAMKERAHLVNGNVSIHSKSGEGTEVRVEVPMSSPA